MSIRSNYETIVSFGVLVHVNSEKGRQVKAFTGEGDVSGTLFLKTQIGESGNHGDVTLVGEVEALHAYLTELLTLVEMHVVQNQGVEALVKLATAAEKKTAEVSA